ncbi:MAG: GNAT family N-acetyltransferase [Amnibacterium sp.]
MTEGDVLIRPLEQADHDRWAELYRGYRAFYELAPSDDVVERVWGWLRDPAAELSAFVAERDGRVVGLAHYRRFLRPSSGSTGLYLDDLFTDPDARGAGVGRALLLRLARLAGEEGASVVRWITDTDNARARRLYDSLAQATRWITYDLAPAAQD